MNSVPTPRGTEEWNFLQGESQRQTLMLIMADFSRNLRLDELIWSLASLNFQIHKTM